MMKKKVTSKNGQTFYWTNENKEKPSMVMLHGLIADHRLFEKQTEEFINDFNLIVWDCPCHGQSRPFNDFSYKMIGNELESILSEEKIDHAVFIGQSLGGMIAQYFIEKHPEMAVGLIAIDSVPFGNYYSKSDMFWLNQLEWMCQLFPDSMLRKSIAKACGVTAYTQNSMMEMLSGYSKNEICRLVWIGEAAFIPENHELNIDCPVVLLLGDNDKVGKVSKYNLEWQRRTEYPLHIIEHAGHNSNQDNPEAVNKLITQYVHAWLTD